MVCMHSAHKSNGHFNTTYIQLPVFFYSKQHVLHVIAPEVYLFNDSLCQEIGMQHLFADRKNIADYLSGKLALPNTQAIAQAYAGHQFGHFTMLGDGRARLLGEWITPNGKRIDVQLKGSGKTPYSRGGDGQATLHSMLREYLISEAMHYLGIPTSRSLAVVLTGEQVVREKMHKGAVLTRLMSSHIRIGTFEYARRYGTQEQLEALCSYTIQRHYPHLSETENPPYELFCTVAEKQIQLVLNWMRVGFIHGVMNTDNTGISAETFDYGPCAYMQAYHPQTTFSSIDTNGRYAYGNQLSIIAWNLSVLADALLPLITAIHPNGLQKLKDYFAQIEMLIKEKWYSMMLQKIGIVQISPETQKLLEKLLAWMQENKADYTNTFFSLQQILQNNKLANENFLPIDWLNEWKQIRLKTGLSDNASAELMAVSNPVYIPRNHLVEEALEAACNGEMDKFSALLEVLKNPYTRQNNKEDFRLPRIDFDEAYLTYCGT